MVAQSLYHQDQYHFEFDVDVEIGKKTKQKGQKSVGSQQRQPKRNNTYLDKFRSSTRKEKSKGEATEENTFSDDVYSDTSSVPTVPTTLHIDNELKDRLMKETASRYNVVADEAREEFVEDVRRSIPSDREEDEEDHQLSFKKDRSASRQSVSSRATVKIPRPLFRRKSRGAKRSSNTSIIGVPRRNKYRSSINTAMTTLTVGVSSLEATSMQMEGQEIVAHPSHLAGIDTIIEEEEEDVKTETDIEKINIKKQRDSGSSSRRLRKMMKNMWISSRVKKSNSTPSLGRYQTSSPSPSDETGSSNGKRFCPPNAATINSSIEVKAAARSDDDESRLKGGKEEGVLVRQHRRPHQQHSHQHHHELKTVDELMRTLRNSLRTKTTAYSADASSNNFNYVPYRTTRNESRIPDTLPLPSKRVTFTGTKTKKDGNVTTIAALRSITSNMESIAGVSQDIFKLYDLDDNQEEAKEDVDRSPPSYWSCGTLAGYNKDNKSQLGQISE